jgi:hypothetical protein
VTKTGTGSGTVSASPGTLSWSGNTGSAIYTTSTVVVLSAQASAGSTFNGWGGDSDCTDGIVTMNNHKNCTATFSLQGLPISYIIIPLNWTGLYYEGSIDFESINSYPSQKFYKIARPASCTTQMQFYLNGHIAGYVNTNMLISDGNFGTPQDALADYQYMLNTYGYLNPQQIFYHNKTYWFHFNSNPASETLSIYNPTTSAYFIQVVNEDTFQGYYDLKAFCW